MTYDYLDESGNLSDENYFFCVGLTFSNKKIEREFEHIIKRSKMNLKMTKGKFISEMKFNNSSDSLRRYILRKINELDIQIIAAIIDKEGRRIKDSISNYSLAISQAVTEMKNKSGLILIIDKKYTNSSQILEFQTIFRNRQSSLLFELRDSKSNYGLQAADFIVGSINYKYNRKNTSYFSIIKDKFISEKVYKWTKIKKKDI